VPRESVASPPSSINLLDALALFDHSIAMLSGRLSSAEFLRIKARRGPKKAILAVAPSMLTAVWHMLSHGVEYADLGPDYFSRHDTSKTIQRLLKRLAGLACHAQPITPFMGTS
jgi:hypothetical protein